MGVLRVKPIGKSRGRSSVALCLEYLCGSLTLQILGKMPGALLLLMLWCVERCTSYGGRVGGRAVREMTLRRRIEQDEVLLRRLQVLLMLLLRGVCRQAL